MLLEGKWRMSFKWKRLSWYSPYWISYWSSVWMIWNILVSFPQPEQWMSISCYKWLLPLQHCSSLRASHLSSSRVRLETSIHWTSGLTSGLSINNAFSICHLSWKLWHIWGQMKMGDKVIKSAPGTNWFSSSIIVCIGSQAQYDAIKLYICESGM